MVIVLHATQAVFLELFFVYWFECYELYIEYGVVIFGALGDGIKA